MVESLTDIVKQTCTFGKGYVGTHFGSQETRNVANLHRMLKNILTVACAVMELTDELNQLGVQVVDSRIQNSALTFALDNAINLGSCLIDHFLNSCGVDSAIHNQLFQCDPSHLAANGIEAGKSDCFGGIVDNKVDTCGSFQCADISSLAADDAAFISSLGRGTTETVVSEE